MMFRKSVSFVVVALFVVLSLMMTTYGMGAEQAPAKRVTKQVPGKKPLAKPSSSKPAGVEAASGKGGGGELSPGQVDTRSAILVDVATGTVLFEQNADEIIEPASFTKIMSLYLIFEALQQGRIHLTDEVWISEAAWRTGGSKMFVGIGTKVPLEELLKGIAVVSGNDSCVAAAEHLYGSQNTFVEAMNRKAQELGMTNSRFLNPHGLPADGQVTSARDMATLDVAYLQRFPESLRFHSMREMTYNDIVQYNRNHLLLKDQTVDGLKTGYVGAAGYHLAATAQRNGMRLLAVVMGATTPAVREREALKLLNYGFRYYTMVQPFPQGQPVASIKVWKGEKDQVDLFPVETPSFMIPQAQKNLLRWEVKKSEEITAPVASNQRLGEIVFYVSDQPKRTVALANHEEVAQAGLFKRTWQSILRMNKINWKWAGGISAGVLLIGGLSTLLLSRRGRRRSFGG